MSTTDKQRADALLASQGSRAELEQALVAQQAVKDKGLNLSIGNNVTLIIALGDTSVENINAFGANSLFETAGSRIPPF